MFADEGEDGKPKLRVQEDAVRAREPESWEGGGIRVRGQRWQLTAPQHELRGRVAQSELRATLSEGLVVSLRRANKGDKATLRGQGEPVSACGQCEQEGARKGERGGQAPEATL